MTQKLMQISCNTGFLPFRYTLPIILILISTSAQSQSNPKANTKPSKSEIRKSRKAERKALKELYKSKYNTPKIDDSPSATRKANKAQSNLAKSQLRKNKRESKRQIKEGKTPKSSIVNNNISNKKIQSPSQKEKKEAQIVKNRSLSQKSKVDKMKTKSTVSQRAKRIYDRLGYMESVNLYEKRDQLKTEDKIRIANGLRLNHEPEEASKWYAMVVKETSEPEQLLRYAQVLQSSGNQIKSQEAYSQYYNLVDEENKWVAIAQKFSAINTEDIINQPITLKNEALINTTGLEYSPTIVPDGIIYVSTRKPDKLPNIDQDPWINENFMSLFKATTNEDGELSAPKAFSYDITTRFHEGPMTFSKDRNIVYFTRNDFNKRKRTNSSKGTMKLQIYKSSRSGDSWTIPEALSFNNKESEECHPSLSEDGKTLYFSSDRPDGIGGMDLYKSELVDGQWSTPVNLGPTINTPGNEVFPFIHNSGILFYASNGHEGLGGLDIFQSKEINDNWMSPTNLGKPFNSFKDDFGFVLNDQSNKGYLSSARNNGYGKDDIYSFKMDAALLKTSSKRLCTMDEPSGNLVPGVSLVIKEQKTECDQPDNSCNPILVTDNFGYTTGIFNPDLDYNIVATKEEYEERTFLAKGADIINSINETYCFPISKKSNCMDFKLEVLDVQNKSAISNAHVTITNNCDRTKFNVITNVSGTIDSRCIPCDCSYNILASKIGMSQDQVSISKLEVPCDSEGIIQKRLFLSSIEKTENKSDINIGDVIVLDNIYYDFDKYNIREDAALELEKVVRLMKKYPSLIIELGSHTDARATDSYNDNLSSKRARSAVEYIISRGIDSRRLVAKGYGELIPRNKCKDGVQCTEVEHQYNRRTEIKVIYIDSNTEIRYEDKGPKTIDPAPVNLRKGL